jgi:hypothetical protein
MRLFGEGASGQVQAETWNELARGSCGAQQKQALPQAGCSEEIIGEISDPKVISQTLVF